MWNDLTRSLRNPNYRRYFAGQLISLHGTQMANVAQSWLVYSLTQSSFMLGLVNFTLLLPVLLFGLFGGVLADHVSRRHLMIGSQGFAMVMAFLLAYLAISGQVEVWHILVIVFFLGMAQAIDMPVRQSFLAELVSKDELSNAVGLNSGAFNMARFVGPAVAGVLLLSWSEGYLFALNGISYFVLLFVLLTMRLPATSTGKIRGAGNLDALKEGVSYAWNHVGIRAALVHVGAVSMMGTAFIVLMPVFADRQFGGGPEMLGLLLSSAGIGSVIGALNLARRTGDTSLSPVIARSGVVAAIALILFAQSGNIFQALLLGPQLLWLATPLLIVAGFSVTTVIATTNAQIQVAVEDHLRGRVMSLFSVIFVGMAPIGSLAAGVLAEVVGIQMAVTMFAILGGGGSLRYWFGSSRAIAR
ncbi:MAG: MFS transporter [Gammaproteobacteria bacterium]|nr:MFS transporter [Gammaproteobacteria bacterium]